MKNGNHYSAWADEELYSRLPADEGAFAELDSRYRKKFLNHYIYRGLSMDDANDIAQDILLRVYMSACPGGSPFNPEHGSGARFGTWIYRIADNLYISFMRGRRNFTPIGNGDDESREIPELQAWDGPERQLWLKEVGEVLDKEISLLPERQRKAIMLVDVEGVTYREASGITGVSEGTVKLQVFYARRKLRDRLSQYGIV